MSKTNKKLRATACSRDVVIEHGEPLSHLYVHIRDREYVWVAIGNKRVWIDAQDEDLYVALDAQIDKAYLVGQPGEDE